MLNSVLRRYTPPTCTLEIAAKDSPLSRWTDRSVLQRLRFQLSFDDPKLPSDQQVRIRGDRGQLDALCETVVDYVQNLLGQHPIDQAAAQTVSSTGADGTVSNGMAASSNWQRSNIEADTRLKTTRLQALGPRSLEQPGAMVSDRASPIESSRSPLTAGIELKPRGLVAHDLHLGTLASEESGMVVRLSVVQLFDLANALDDYAADVLVLPEFKRSGWLRSPQGWASIAAVALVSFGITGSLIKFVSDLNAPIETASSATRSPSNSQPPLSANPPAGSAALPPAGTPSGKLTNPPNPIPLPPPPPSGTTLSPGNRPAPSSTAPRPNSAPLPRAATPALPPLTIAPVPSTQIQIPTQRTAAPSSTAQSAESAALGDNGNANSVNPNAAAVPSEDRLAVDPTPRSTTSAFDTIPQVAEARAYFQARWRSPEGLNQTLEYRLTVNPDGTIDRIVPLGQAAGDYVDRTEIPLIGESFVSAIDSGKTAEIRLVLSPDGRVRTLLESLN